MLIGEIVKRTGLSRDTIRFYEKKKLFSVERTDSQWNNYKNYTEDSVSKLILIKKAKGFGFTLKEISALLDLYESNNATCETITLNVQDKIKSIDKKIKDLKDMKKMILGKLDDAKELCRDNPNNNCKSI